MTPADDGLNALREVYPNWAFWHVSGHYGAIHRQTGVIIDAPEHATWAEVLAAADALLRGGVASNGDEGAELRNRVDQPLISQLGDNLPRGTAGDTEFLDELRLRRDDLAGAIDADSDAAAKLAGDLHPHRLVGTEVDHDGNVEDHGPA